MNCEIEGKCLIIFSNRGINTAADNSAISENFEFLGNESEMSMKQRNQANARERYRTHRWDCDAKMSSEIKNRNPNFSSSTSVNSAFNTLRLLIPTEPKNRKLSKIETLRLAKSYISHLNATLTTGKWERERE